MRIIFRKEAIANEEGGKLKEKIASLSSAISGFEKVAKDLSQKLSECVSKRDSLSSRLSSGQVLVKDVKQIESETRQLSIEIASLEGRIKENSKVLESHRMDAKKLVSEFDEKYFEIQIPETSKPSEVEKKLVDSGIARSLSKVISDGKRDDEFQERHPSFLKV